MVDARPTADISRVGTVFDKTQADPDAGSAAVSAGKATEASVAESRWESLVKTEDDEDKRDSVPAALAGERSIIKTWPIIVAASVLGLFALGVVALVMRPGQPANDSHPDSARDARAHRRGLHRLGVETVTEKESRESAPPRTAAADPPPVAAAPAANPRVLSSTEDRQRLPEAADRASTTGSSLPDGSAGRFNIRDLRASIRP